MQDNVIYHNPRCRKCRATLALLQEHGADVTGVEYLKAPPPADVIAVRVETARVAIEKHYDKDKGESKRRFLPRL